MIELILILCFVVFAYISGYIEAYFWATHPKVNQRTSHIMLTILRLIVVLPIIICTQWINLIVCMCIFPLIHDGTYYQTRNQIDENVYPNGWTDHSITTGALLSFTFIYRVLLAMVGIIIFALT